MFTVRITQLDLGQSGIPFQASTMVATQARIGGRTQDTVIDNLHKFEPKSFLVITLDSAPRRSPLLPECSETHQKFESLVPVRVMWLSIHYAAGGA